MNATRKLYYIVKEKPKRHKLIAKQARKCPPLSMAPNPLEYWNHTTVSTCHNRWGLSQKGNTYDPKQPVMPAFVQNQQFAPFR
jgi:hypothetical protein